MLVMMNIGDKTSSSVRSACNNVIRDKFDIKKLYKKRSYS